MPARLRSTGHQGAVLFVLAATAALVLAGPAAARGPTAAQAPLPEIPYEQFVLKNGLTVLVHEDHKAPIVAVNVWYHVGSKNEKPGKTGFAHLFEHLMFNGSENYNEDYFLPLERIGATDLNGTTNSDRTNYFQNVPSSAVDVALFMESDRMGHLIGAIDQAKLDEQRGVVRNEKRQGENQPYGTARTLLSENTYPPEHPYHWTTIGSMEDLQAAALEDVHEWFRSYYGPGNAVLVVAGDIDVATARQKVEHWFGDIPPGPPVGRQQKWVAKMTGEHRQVIQDRVPQARVYKVWNVPEWGAAEADYLSLAASVLGDGKTSRLYERLVYRDRIATDAAAFVWQKELGSQLYIQATAVPGGDLAAVEAAIDEELARLLESGPSEGELQRVKADERASFIRGAERIGGFGGKSDILASNLVFGGDPEFYRLQQERVAAATVKQVGNAARKWLADGVFVLSVHPYPEVAAAAEGADRSALPPAGSPPAPDFPAIETAKLSNGLEIFLAHRPTAPLVHFTLLLDAGYAADHGGMPGTAGLTMDMLDEGAGRLDALGISEAMTRLGANLWAGAELDFCQVGLSALTATLDEALAIYAAVIRAPTFPQDELERLQKELVARIRREKTTPNLMGMRVLPALLYGPGHAYSVPMTGTGTEEAVARIGREDVVAFHRTWFRPNNAAMVVVGNATMEEIQPKLERLFGGWAVGSVPAKAIGQVAPKTAPELYLIDRPGSQQSVVFAGHLAPPASDPDEIAIWAVNRILGGTFTSRINMNLRENKHWTYGARAGLQDARGQGWMMVTAPVQGDKTAETIEEIRKELRGIVADAPPTAEELDKTKASLTLSLPGRWETIGAVAGSVGDIVRWGRPLDYYELYPGRIEALELGELSRVAQRLVQPESVVWVVVGDAQKVLPALQGLGLGEVRLIDADGKPVGAPGI